MSSSYQGLPSLPRRLCWEPNKELTHLLSLVIVIREYNMPTVGEMKIEERSITHTTNQTAEFGPGGPFARQGSTIKALIAQFSGFY